MHQSHTGGVVVVILWKLALQYLSPLTVYYPAHGKV